MDNSSCEHQCGDGTRSLSCDEKQFVWNKCEEVFTTKTDLHQEAIDRSKDSFFSNTYCVDNESTIENTAIDCLRRGGTMTTNEERQSLWEYRKDQFKDETIDDILHASYTTFIPHPCMIFSTDPRE